MGQAASKQAANQARRVAGQSAKSSTPAASAATAASSPQAPPPRPPPLGRPVADAPDVIEDPTEGLKQRQLKETEELLMKQPLPQQSAGGPTQAQPPQPDQNSGFYRGQIVDPRDVAQEQFLAHQSGLPAAATRQQLQQQPTPELAPDLLKFLQDVGPLEKKVNKEMTSPRILKELEDGNEEEKMQQLDAEANLRTRDDMRLVDNIDGFSTPRTTNFFSTDVLEEEEEADFGLTDLEIYELLKRSAEATATKDDTIAVCSTFHEEMLKKKKSSDSKDDEIVWTEAEQEEQQQLLKDTMKFLALPVVVKDDEMNYLGAHQSELEKEFSHHQKIDVVEETRVKLVLADLVDLGKKEIRRIRD